MSNKCIWIAAIPILAACGTSKNKANVGTIDDPKFAMYAGLNLTKVTFVKCGVTGDGIACDDKLNTMPASSSFAVVYNFENTDFRWLNRLENGCYIDEPDKTGTKTPVIWKYSLEDDSKNCKIVSRLYKGVEEDPFLEERALVGSFAGNINPLQMLRLSLKNIDGQNECERYVYLTGRDTKRALSFVNTDMTFSSLFSLQPAQSLFEIKSANKSDDFVYKFTPALNLEELRTKGVDEKNVIDYLTPHLGDFVVLNLSDSYGHKAFCKADDAIEGEIKIPASIMKTFESSVSFKITRHKSLNKVGSDNFEVFVESRVGEYVSGSDAYGFHGGYKVKLK